MVAPITISITPSCSPHEITPRSTFLSKSDKVYISQYGGHFGKKMVAWKKCLYFHHDRHIKVPQDINVHCNRTKLTFSRYGSHFEKNGGPEFFFNSTIIFATPNTTCSSWNYLSSYHTFRDIKCQSSKIRKKKQH